MVTDGFSCEFIQSKVISGDKTKGSLQNKKTPKLGKSSKQGGS